MTTPHVDQLINDYLARLGSELADLPPSRLEEILDEISNHIAEERSRLHDDSEADLRNLLDRLGDPSELAAAARTEPIGPEGAKHRPRIRALEVLAVVLTPLVWPVGVTLLWISPAWNLRDRLIGTLVPPGGYLLLFAVPILGLWNGFTSECGGSGASWSCTGFVTLPAWQQFLLQASVVVVALSLLVLPILTAIYLASRLQKSRGHTAVT